jgi:hypothetical protein
MTLYASDLGGGGIELLEKEERPNEYEAEIIIGCNYFVGLCQHRMVNHI